MAIRIQDCVGSTKEPFHRYFWIYDSFAHMRSSASPGKKTVQGGAWKRNTNLTQFLCAGPLAAGHRTRRDLSRARNLRHRQPRGGQQWKDSRWSKNMHAHTFLLGARDSRKLY